MIKESSKIAEKYGIEKVYDKIENMLTDAVIACEKAYIEIMEYPRADKAKVVYTETGKIDENQRRSNVKCSSI